MKISVTIPTLRSQQEIMPQMQSIINSTIGMDVEVYASCKKQSAAKNRNDCIHNTKGDIIVMCDDDIVFSNVGWCKALIQPLITNPEKYSIVSARTTDSAGKVNGLLGDAGDSNCYGAYQIAQHVKGSTLQLVASACIAFTRADALAIMDNVNRPFDENYVQACFEDSDFSLQMRKIFPNKDIILNNNCKVVHMNKMSGRNSEGVTKNNRYFNRKWQLSL